jgi:hypothetical protein
MSKKERNPIDLSLKQAKYRDLKANNNDKFLQKIAKRSDSKKFWHDMVGALQRLENFHGKEDDFTQRSQKAYAHHLSKLQLMEQIQKEA